MAALATYPSGKWHFYEADPSEVSVKRSERAAHQLFLSSHFPLVEGVHWVPKSRLADHHHVHSLFQLTVDGIPVDGHFVKTHFNRRGFLEYATSLWEVPWEKGALRRSDRLSGNEAEMWVLGELDRRYLRYGGHLSKSPVWWSDPGTLTLVPAMRFEVNWWEKGIVREWIVVGDPYRLVEERNLVRYASAVNKSVYKVSPLNMGATFDTVDVDNLDVGTILANDYVHVYREFNTASPTLADVDPQNNYTAAEFSRNVAQYAGTTCTTCENQKFDSVNTYYHLNLYRRYLQTLYTSLGISSVMTALLADPLTVIVNALSIDFDDDGNSVLETNNAAYVSSTCRLNFSPTYPRCLAILRPEGNITTSSCGGGLSTVDIFHLGREANVIVHEYQHYLTDRVTEMIPGSYTAANVGDLLHEGYSDYFGASQVSRLNSTDVTAIGEYAFQECSALIRDVAVLTPYTNSAAAADPHYAGLTWASGLWHLRESLGVTSADLLAIQSQFFLSPRPSFIEAVEALVKADKALFSGEHVAQIRTLYYTTLTFTGAETNLFRDPATGVVDTGFHSCGASPRRRSMGWLAAVGFFLWLGGLLWLGRRFARR